MPTSNDVETEVQLHDFANIFSLSGKVAVVTGGSRGLGLNTASGLLQAGCSLVIITSRKPAACTAAATALNALPNLRPGARAVAIPADSSTGSGIAHLVAEVSRLTDHVDILFANAGATWGEAFETHPEAALTKVLELNVKGVFVAVQKFAGLLGKAASRESPARVVVTASIAGLGIAHLGKNATFGYAASKAAVINLTKSLACELGPRNILVNAVAPGFFPTRMANGLIALQGGEEKLAAEVPDGKLGRPEDIAAAVVYLTSRAGQHVNGATLVVDGGAIVGSSRL